MAYTISFQSRGLSNQAHNRRDKKTVERANQRDAEAGLEPHIDLQGEYLNWIDKKPVEALHEALDAVIESYNAKQKRKDRRTSLEHEIDKYKKKIADKNTDLVREVIISIGNRSEHPPAEECRQFYRCVLAKFKKENPNFLIVGAYYHADEPNSAPHMHLDYIPLHKKRKRGLEWQIGMAGALEDLGYSNSAGFSTQQARDDGALAAWDKHMRKSLYEIAHNMGYQTQQGKGEHREHVETRIFKQEEKLRNLERSIEMKNEILQEMNRDITERTLERTKDIRNPFRQKERVSIEIEREPICW